MRAASDSFYVYVHSRYKNGEPFYVGKGCGRRIVAGKRNRHWHNVVNKDGGFYASIVARGIDEEFALLLEKEVIDKYRRAGARLTNRTNGGDGVSGMRHTAEAKARIGAASAGNTYAKGNRLSQDARAKIGKASKGNKHALGYRHTPEALERIRTALLGTKRPGKPGRKHSPETIAKLVALKTGLKHSAETRAKLSASHMGLRTCLGYKHSAETRANMSAAHIGRPTGPMSPERKANISAALRESWKRRKGG